MRTGAIHAPDQTIFRLTPEAQFYGLQAMEEELDKLIRSSQVSIITEEGIISLDEIKRRSNIKIEYSLSPVKSLLVNKNGYNILTTLCCLKKVSKCPRNVPTHTEPYWCGNACEKLAANRWVKEEERLYLVSRNKLLQLFSHIRISPRESVYKKKT